jgi:hypothetical protein
MKYLLFQIQVRKKRNFSILTQYLGVTPLVDPLKHLVNNVLGISSEALIKQYDEAPILQSAEPEHPLLRWNTKWNLLSILIHRSDKEAKKWVNTKRETTIYTYLKKGQKNEFAERIEKSKQQQETVVKPQ